MPLMVRLIGAADEPDGPGDDDPEFDPEFDADEVGFDIDVEVGFGVAVLIDLAMRVDADVDAEAGVVGRSSASRVGAPAPKVFTGAAPWDECAA